MTITQKLDCTENDVDIALLNHQERLAEIQTAMEPDLAALKAQASALQSSFITPFENNLERLLAPTGFSVQEMSDQMGLLSSTSKVDNEIYLQTRYGISVVNGRVLVPGGVNITALKVLKRLVGTTAQINALIPELASVDVTQPFTIAPLPSRFIFIITKEDSVVVDTTKCRKGYTTTTEVTVGINRSIGSVLKQYPSLTREDLKLYVFWVGEPAATKLTRRSAFQWGLTNEEFAYALTQTSINNLYVYVISNPIDLINITDTFNDTDDILDRGPDTINMNPSPDEIVTEVNKAMPVQTGSNTSVGASDCGSGPGNIFNTVDVDKTFGVTDNLVPDPCYGVTAAQGVIDDAMTKASKVMNAVTTALNTPQIMLNNLNNEIATIARPVMNKLTQLLSVASNILGDPDFLKCYFTGSFSIDLALGGLLGPLNKLMDLLDKGAAAIYDFLDIISKLLILLGQIACIQGSLSEMFDISGGVLSRLTTTFGLQCAITDKPNFGDCFTKGVNLAKYAAGLLNTLFAALLFNLRALQMFVLNLQTNLKGAVESSSLGSLCNPTETAILTALLTKLGLAAGESIGPVDL